MEVREWSTIGISWTILPEIDETLREVFRLMKLMASRLMNHEAAQGLRRPYAVGLGRSSTSVGIVDDTPSLVLHHARAATGDVPLQTDRPTRFGDIGHRDCALRRFVALRRTQRPSKRNRVFQDLPKHLTGDRIPIVMFQID